MGGRHPLSRAEGVRRFDRDPDSIGFAVADFAGAFCLTEAEALAELRSGRLSAHRDVDSDEPFILGSSAVAWLANHDVDPWLIQRHRVRDALLDGEIAMAVVRRDDRTPTLIPKNWLTKAQRALVAWLQSFNPHIYRSGNDLPLRTALSEEADRAGDAKMAGLLIANDAILVVNGEDVERTFPKP